MANTKKNATTSTVTVNATTTAKMNIEKLNTVTVNDIYKVFADTVNGQPCKINFSASKSQPYCGLSDFSVNMKKKSFNVYMSENNAKICKSLDKSLEILPNTSDLTKKQLRSKLVIFAHDQIDTLLKCIIKVTETKLATVTTEN